ncbi:MAG: hypothetical protein JNL35_17190 [Sphingopyxis sp.]|nr:hypothetical protein [Sphingopyxis sp.]
MAQPPKKAKAAPPPETLNVQVFLDDAIAPSDIEPTIQAQVKVAQDSASPASAGATPDVVLGRISKLAKSYNLKASKQAIDAIRGMSGVVGVLPENSDAMLKPITRRVLPKDKLSE